MRELDTLAPADRLPILRVFLPVEAEAVERGWQFQRSQPHSSRYGQGTLWRAPGRPDLALAQRQTWLLALAGVIGAYHEDVFWLARHAAYLHDYHGHTLGLLFAAVIEADPDRGDALFDQLMATARGEDAVASYGRYLPVALLAASRPEGWACIERVLLGAAREEGVRQTILEALSAAHPHAFAHMLGLIGEHQLTRFSAVTRAVNGWLGTTWDSAQAPAVARTVEALRLMLTDPERRERALAEGSGEEAYLALWATATEDVMAALPQAERLLDDPDVARRYAATRLLAGTLLREALPLLAGRLRDADPRVAAQACVGLQSLAYPAARAGTAHELAADPLFEAIEAALPGLPARARTMPPLLWNVPVPPATREHAADLLLTFLGARDPRRLIPYLGTMSQSGRVNAAKRLAQDGLSDAAVRQAVMGLARDRSRHVADQALTLLAAAPVDQVDDATLAALEALLGRKLEALRRSVMALVLRLPDARALASTERLLGSGNVAQRLAGLELVRLLHEAGRAPEGTAALARAYRA
ncbi:MAG TPA: hypothetical protein VET66_15700, partial [Steroidobacteraceae bacterium]|nr:hypothetical protein [Steroidobacteraceae bacterium]